jgi:hypothetical protein
VSDRWPPQHVQRDSSSSLPRLNTSTRAPNNTNGGDTGSGSNTPRSGKGEFVSLVLSQQQLVAEVEALRELYVKEVDKRVSKELQEARREEEWNERLRQLERQAGITTNTGGDASTTTQTHASLTSISVSSAAESSCSSEKELDARERKVEFDLLPQTTVISDDEPDALPCYCCGRQCNIFTRLTRDQ